jgi:hypothetical protein
MAPLPTRRNNGLPWDNRPERADLLIMGGIVASGLYALLLLPLVPTLVGSHPVLLELLRGSTVAIVTVGALARTGHASLVVALLAGIPSLIAFASVESVARSMISADVGPPSTIVAAWIT